MMGYFLHHNFGEHAGIAQLVERNLAKVEVESSRLFSRSISFSSLNFPSNVIDCLLHLGFCGVSC